MTRAFVEMERLRTLHSGLGQLCLRLGRAMARMRPEGLDLCFYVPRERLGIFGDAPSYAVHSSMHKLVPASWDAFDVWHCTHQDSRYLPPRRATKLVFTIQDLNFLQKYSGARRWARLRTLQRKIDRADALTFISRCTEETVREHLRVGDRPARVIPLAASLEVFEGARRPRFAPDGPFLFTIGIVQPKKNFHVLLPLLRDLPGLSLVVAGSDASPYARSIRTLAEELGVADRVILPGSVTEEEKYWLHANCEAFVFPSLAEGFGIPVIEAMSLGKPVFLSTFTSLPETGGPEAFYWKELEPAAMRHVFEDGMRAYRSDPGKAERIRRWAARFSWDEAARAYLALYEELAPRAAGSCSK